MMPLKLCGPKRLELKLAALFPLLLQVWYDEREAGSEGGYDKKPGTKLLRLPGLASGGEGGKGSGITLSPALEPSTFARLLLFARGFKVWRASINHQSVQDLIVHRGQRTPMQKKRRNTIWQEERRWRVALWKEMKRLGLEPSCAAILKM